MKRMIKVIFKLPIDLWLEFITYLPGRIGFFLRNSFWSKRLKYLGNNTKIDTGVYFQNPSYIIINDNCWVDKNVIILAGLDNSNREKITIRNNNSKDEPGTVYIGNNIHIGIGCIISGISAGVYISDDCGFSANCKVYAFSNHYRSKKAPNNSNINFGPMVPYERQCLIEGHIFFGKNTGIALNAVILPGANIGQNSFVTINSVISKTRVFRENSIISGNPAKEIAKRFLIEEHEGKRINKRVNLNP